MAMNGSTKILTVSYGTFSCTLEGFDDPLGSMREIAEYFRDLAADDRYFGAEPPTPDVEMLQNLAEQDVQRRVDTRVTDTGVALVASSDAVDAEPAPEAEVADPGQDTKGPLTFDDDFLLSDEPEDVLAVDPDASADADGPAESVAEKLRRIRAVVSKSIEDSDDGTVDVDPSGKGAGQVETKRDRALTDTIQQITADLADDEDAHNFEDTVEDAVEVDDAAPLVDNVPEGMEIVDDLVASERASDVVAEAADADAGLDEDDDMVADVLGKVSSRLEDDDDAPEVEPKAERVTTRTLSPEPEVDVGRLLDETDTKLNEDETVRRRRVISQMRAAVAATKADRLVSRQVSREDEEEAEKDPYREDLSEAVQDGPQADAARKPSMAPPLMLVSSQRVDEEKQAQAEDALAKADGAKAPESFADFVESVGAKELDELLEAAAAYTVFAEGQASFTRPEIMKRVAHADPTLRLSREESLRSFGQLLRQGKFKKLERGQFTIDEATKFHPTQRYVGE